MDESSKKMRKEISRCHRRLRCTRLFSSAALVAVQIMVPSFGMSKIISPFSDALMVSSSNVNSRRHINNHSRIPEVTSLSSPPWTPNHVKTKKKILPAVTSIRGGSNSELSMSPGSASLIAGSIAGAIGVGIAFPLDTLKTKSQVLAQKQGGGSDAVAAQRLGMFQLIQVIWKSEGISGFFGGVRGMMVGQAIIKSVAFSANANALSYINDYISINSADFISPVASLIMAAMFAGFVTSFLVAPIERIKVMMQASDGSSKIYDNEIACARAVVQNEGWLGLFGRGLGPTLVREVPSYAIYFVVYGVLIQTQFAATLGSTGAPLIMGALSGMACWIPVYPVDVVKTLAQNTVGGADADKMNTIDIAQKLYREGGIGAFFDGLTPKMLRAALNHSVTFWVYDLVLNYITATSGVGP